MKISPSTLLLASAALLCGSSFAAAPQDPGEDRVAALEARVATLEAKLAADSGGADAAELAQMRGLVLQTKRQADQITVYLQAQAESAQALQKALEESKAKGFTYGINPDSRVTLLAGMDGFAASLQKDVPAPQPVESAQATPQQRPARAR